MDEHEVTQDDLDDAIVEDTCHCDLCGSPFLVGDNGPVIVDGEAHGSLVQIKFCEHCASKVHDAYRENLRYACICEHGVADGEFCEECSKEYKRARGRLLNVDERAELARIVDMNTKLSRQVVELKWQVAEYLHGD